MITSKKRHSGHDYRVAILFRLCQTDSGITKFEINVAILTCLN